MKVKDLLEILGKANKDAYVAVMSNDDTLDNAIGTTDAFEIVGHHSDGNNDWVGFYIVTA